MHHLVVVVVVAACMRAPGPGPGVDDGRRITRRRNKQKNTPIESRTLHYWPAFACPVSLRPGARTATGNRCNLAGPVDTPNPQPCGAARQGKEEASGVLRVV